VVLSLVLLLGGAYYATLRPGQDWGGDFSQYINHARNLALGHDYLETRYVVMFPESASHMPPAYPPIFPLILAPVYRHFGLDYIALKIVVQVMFLISAVVYYAVARFRGLGMVAAAFAMLAFSLSGLVLSLKDLINSESTYLVFSGLTLIALLLIERNKWDETRTVTASLVIATLMLLSYGTRAIGVALIVAFVLNEVFIKKRIRLFSVLVVCTFTLGVVLMGVTLYSSRSYAGEFHFAPRMYLQNLIACLKSPASLWCDPTPRYVRWPLFVLTIGVALTAVLRKIVRGPTVIEFYAIAVMVPVVLHSTGFTDRYLIPVYVLYFIYFMEGIAWLCGKYVRVRSWIPVCTFVLLGLGAAVNLYAMEKGPYREGVEQATFLEVCRYIRGSVDADSMIISWNPRVLALYTDRTSAWYPYTESDDQFNGYLDRAHASYVLLYTKGQKDNQWLAPHLMRQPERFELVFSNQDFQFYRLESHPVLFPSAMR
jgi:hypothetical protein